MGKAKKIAAGMAALALLMGGCAKEPAEPAPGPETARPSPTEAVETAREAEGAETERLAALKAAEEKLEGYRWPRETVKKTIAGRETEFILYHGNGWTMHVPADWEERYTVMWEAPSGNAGFWVSKQFLPVNNPKWYRAETGSWRHETSYAPPFDYYYDDDGGYTPPDGEADYIYFFAPDGEDNSYELTLGTVAGETTDEEKTIQEAMLLSFTIDESSHMLRSEDYVPGETEWDAAMAGLMAEGEPIWFSRYHDGALTEPHGKNSPDYFAYAKALTEFRPEGFAETFFGERPEEVKDMDTDGMITLCLPGLQTWLYFYEDSPWVCVSTAGEDYWTKTGPEESGERGIFDAALAWLEAESAWETERRVVEDG